MSKACMVLGGAGFIGSHIAALLVKNGYSVKLFDCAPEPKDPSLRSKIEYIQGDYSHFSGWGPVLKDVDFVFHNLWTTIPSTSNKDPLYDIDTNVVANVRFLNEMVKYDVKKFVFSSSGGTIYGQPQVIPIPETHPTDPICSYAISKLSVEKYLQYFNYHYGLDFVSLRYSNAYGIGQDPGGMLGAVSVFLGMLARKQPITVFGDGSIVRDYLYIDDVAEANLCAIQKKTRSRIFNVGTGKGTSIKELIDIIAEVTGQHPEVIYTGKRDSDVDTNILDISLIRRELGWKPLVDLREGIRQIWKTMS